MVARSRFRSWDDCYVPGTDVLANKAGITDADELRRFEEFATHARLQELARQPIPGDFDYDHMKRIHHHIFQDVYEWAGQPRVGPAAGQWMSKDGHHYYPIENMNQGATAEYAAIRRNLVVASEHDRLPRDQFVAEFAERWAELNVVHSFREGNTRSQFAFFGQLAERCGYHLDAEQFRVGGPLRDEFVAARYRSQATGRSDALAATLDKAITEKPNHKPHRDMPATNYRSLNHDATATRHAAYQQTQATDHDRRR